MTAASTVAALYVEKDGAYFGLPGVDPWDEERDARLYAGPWPVVAHPPCARWSVPAAYWRRKCLLNGHLFVGTAGYGNRICLLCGRTV